ncbi:hypothetical protein [Maritalea porphyrae]|uniref:hypothetical protein n=1 Tax=Maritalea porphyrae TaxID=880732 RepID=UPI0022AF6E82|nr:hypothetical protein [Maritalea porphyrae]MCZ4273308.1 hypothetical protein [Maritalea porphyrae]
MSEKQSYPVLSPVRHDGQRYAPDDEQFNTITLTDKEAVPLKALGCIPKEQGEPQKANEPDLTDVQRIEKIKEAIGDLDAEKDFKKDGAPKAASVNTLLDFDVSADEINAVWATIKPADEE